MADLIQKPNGQAKDSVNAGNLGTINMFYSSTGLSQLPFHADGSLYTLDKSEENKIALHPLYGTTTADNFLVIPVAPSDIMFNEESDPQTVKLINYGELPISMNRKLASWSITSFFPAIMDKVGYYDVNHSIGSAKILSNPSRYWFDVSDRNETPKDPYQYYCKTILDWKNNQTPLVFHFNTWKDGSGNQIYYYCQVKKFEFGRKDYIGNVYYQLDFQEYKEYTLYDNSATSTDYSADTYYPASGETILQVIKKMYGSSSEKTLEYFMNLNNLTIPKVKAGVGYKVR